ncbi:MAG: M3 family metallopeptidase [Puniceicoccales bacterium]|jgi:oligopeptidase A|nr:M3 family metallopeptidase [Puniceicoccales bacterium]
MAIIIQQNVDINPIEWVSMDAERMRSAVVDGIAAVRDTISTICTIPVPEANFENCIEALERATEPLDVPWAIMEHSVCHKSTDELRAKHGEVLGPVAELYGSIALNEKLWERVLAASKLPSAANLGIAEKRLLDETLRDFRDGGADLPPAKKARLLELRKQLARETQIFSDRVQDAMDGWELFVEDLSQLDGLPEQIKAITFSDGAAHGREGTWRLTLHAPVYGPAMRYLRSNELRKKLWSAHNTLCSAGDSDNGPTIIRILAMRKEEAELLGYKNFADCVLSRRMAKSGEGALQFTVDLHGRIVRQFNGEFERLRRFKETVEGVDADPLEPWEAAYYGEEQCKVLHNFDDEQLRPYFQLDDVIGGLFSLAERLYGLRFVEHPTGTGAGVGDGSISVWHDDVRYFTVHERTGEPIGGFYMDLFPREGKRPGAWENVLIQGHRGADGIWVRPLGTISANVTQPTDGKQSHLTHGEVETIFHEFGHLLHSLFGKVKYASINGTNVVWDFVELPSQIMENWVWEYDCLRTFAKNRAKNNEVLPLELFQRMKSARNYQIAMATMRQISMQKMDLDLHISYDGGDLDDFIDKSTEGYLAKYPTKPLSIIRQFNHLFSDPIGYAAGYYSYKWAEVLDADAFERFLEDGIFNGETANAFRREILERGNLEPADVLYVKFRGREPSIDALLRRCELLLN